MLSITNSDAHIFLHICAVLARPSLFVIYFTAFNDYVNGQQSQFTD